jgi:diguanylate cyclase
MNLTSTQYDPSRAQARQTLIAHKLARAISEHGLQVHYQPEMDMGQQQVVSFEALCRWHDPELNQVAPDEFIAVAEARGQIVALGAEILRMVLADLPHILGRWPKARVAINVSGLELAQADFAAQFLAMVDRSQAAFSNHLELEITESVFHHDVPTLQHNLQALKARGITVAMDDFGTGQSSLSRLHTLPFDKIKMDRSFVLALGDPMVQAIVKAMVDLTQRFGRTLVAEGVETPEQLRTLQSLGYVLAQGYLISPPRPLAGLLTWPH